MEKVAIFIDGAYLDRLLQDEFNSARIDYGKLVTKMSTGLQILRSYYYHCYPYKSPNPTPEEIERFTKKQKFFYSLEQIPRFDVRLGQLEFRGLDSIGKSIFVQKRVDILLGVDLVQLALKRTINNAIILAGDSDFLPAIEVAKNEGVIISLFHGTIHPPHNDLWQTADERFVLNNEYIKDIFR